MNMPFNHKIPEQLLHHVNLTEQWFSEQEYNSEYHISCDPTDVLQAARKLSTALGKVPDPDEPSLEWRIFIHALTELAQMVTTTLSELTQGRFISCLIMTRPAQELAQTVWHALKNEKLVEWYQYSILKDIEDWQEIQSMVERTLTEEAVKSDQLSTEIEESGKEEINKCEARIRELKALETALGNSLSEEEWRKLKTYWQPRSEIFAERLEGHNPQARLDNIQKANWLALNGYLHARSREFGPPPELREVISQLWSTFLNINLVVGEVTKKYTPQQGITPPSTEG